MSGIGGTGLSPRGGSLSGSGGAGGPGGIPIAEAPDAESGLSTSGTGKKPASTSSPQRIEDIAISPSILAKEKSVQPLEISISKAGEGGAEEQEEKEEKEPSAAGDTDPSGTMDASTKPYVGDEDEAEIVVPPRNTVHFDSKMQIRPPKPAAPSQRNLANTFEIRQGE